MYKVLADVFSVDKSLCTYNSCDISIFESKFKFSISTKWVVLKMY